MSGSTSVLKVSGISKSYGETRVLDRVSIDVGANEIIGVVGENGAGKSTLFNIISGIVTADEGHMELHGQPFRPGDYHAASLKGVSRVFQEQALIPNIRVYENLVLSHESLFCKGLQLVDNAGMVKTAKRIVAAAGLDIDVMQRTSDLSFSKRQLVEIARACIVPSVLLDIEHPIVLLDEPTSALDRSDETAFFDLMSRLKEKGSLIFVSHRLTEVLEVSDRIYVLKDGNLVAEVDPDSSNERQLHGLMVGRERDADYYHEDEQRQVNGAAILFETKGLGLEGVYEDVNLTLRAGEVLGIGGLLNSGKSEFGKGAAGIQRPDRGSIVFEDFKGGLPEFSDLIGLGLGYVPAERLAEGMISLFTVAWNLSLASGRDIFSGAAGIWRRRKETEVAERFIADLAIKASGADAPCDTLSGGNQQKVVLARWLCRDPKVLILDNPTRGVDAGAKEEIYAIIRRLTSKGVGIILITDELLELIGLSNRIAIMKHGQVTTIVDAPQEAKPSEREIIQLMLSDVTIAGRMNEEGGANAVP
jgi:ribose transport system ATP-binding protein